MRSILEKHEGRRGVRDVFAFVGPIILTDVSVELFRPDFLPQVLKFSRSKIHFVGKYAGHQDKRFEFVIQASEEGADLRIVTVADVGDSPAIDIAAGKQEVKAAAHVYHRVNHIRNLQLAERVLARDITGP